MPGHVFQADAGEQVDLEVGLTLSTRDPVSYLEVIKNGRRVHEVRLADWAKAGGKLPPLAFDESGWFVIRAVTDGADTYRFAATAPYYVEIGYQRRISRSSVRFFLDWLDEREKVFPQATDELAELQRKRAPTGRTCSRKPMPISGSASGKPAECQTAADLHDRAANLKI